MNKKQLAGSLYVSVFVGLFSTAAHGAGTSYFNCTSATSVFAEACWTNGIPNSGINEYAIFDAGASALVKPGFVSGNIQTGFGAWDMIVGRYGAGNVNHQNTMHWHSGSAPHPNYVTATVTVSNNMILGQFAGSSGVYEKRYDYNAGYDYYGNRLVGPINTNIGQLYVGQSGSGTYYQSVDGSTTVSNFIHIGESATGIGNLGLVRGTLTAPDLVAGYNGEGTFSVTGGQASISSKIILGANPGSVGTMNIEGFYTGAVTTYDEYIGWSGTGAVNQLIGTHTVRNYLYLGYAGAGSAGTYNLRGGTLSAGNVRVGQYTSGTVNVSGGSFDVTGTLAVGAANGAVGAMNINGGSVGSGRAIVGWQGTGSVDQTAGSVSTPLLELGYDGATGATGTYSLSGTGSLNASSLYIGAYSIGNFNQSGGNATASTIAVGRYAGSDGVLAQTGGTASASVETVVGWDGAGAVDHSGGTLGTVNLELGRNAGSGGTYTQSGSAVVNVSGTLKRGAGSGTYNLQGGKLTANTIETTISGLTFNFTGGTLSVDTVLGDLTNDGGILSPGASPGLTQIRGDYTQTAGTYFVEIGGTASGQYDVLDIFDVADLGGVLSVSLVDLGSGVFAPQLGDTFDILFAQTIISPFDSLALASLDSLGLGWQISYLVDEFNTQDVVRLTVVSAVPLPAAAWLFVSGVIALLGVARRKHRGWLM